MATGAFVKNAFKDARQAMSRVIYNGEGQNAQAETDGNHQFNSQDLTQLGDYCFGQCNQTAGAAPEINPLSPTSLVLNGEKKHPLTITVNALQPLKTAWVMVQRPDDVITDPDEPLQFETVTLQCNKQDQCQGEYTRFDVKGEYRLNFYAQDTKGDVSFPETLVVNQTEGGSVLILGDANGDGDVNIQDIVATINLILMGGDAVKGSDCNADEQMNIQDVVCTINKVLAG